jgi:DNA-binding XRE family transcriptional regulator
MTRTLNTLPDFDALLRETRLKARLSQQEVAELVGVARNTLVRWETPPNDDDGKINANHRSPMLLVARSVLAAIEAEYERRVKDGFPPRMDKEGKGRGRPLTSKH